MLTHDQIRAYEAETNRHSANIKSTYARRDEGRHTYRLWSEACEAWHSWKDQQHQFIFLETQQNLARIRFGHDEAIQEAIAFLEVDPWYLYSGNIKERLLRALKAAPLNSHEKARLRNVLLNIVHAKDQREIKSYWGLLKRVWTPEFEEQLLLETRRSGKDWKLKRLQHYLHSNRAFFPKSETE